MSCARHHAMIVTSWNWPLMDAALATAQELGLPVSQLVQSPINGYRTLFIAPDGYKSHMDESDDYDRKRDAFIDWLNSHRYEDTSSPFNWMEVLYGDPCEDGEEDGKQYQMTRTDLDGLVEQPLDDE